MWLSLGLLLVACVLLLVGARALLRGVAEPQPRHHGSIVVHLRVSSTKTIPVIVPSQSRRLFLRGQTWDHVSTTSDGEWVYEQVK